MLKSSHPIFIRERAFTLVELLVAMAIMIMFGALTVAFYPSISSDNDLSRIVNQVQGFLVGARQTARRELVSTGIRFIPSTNNPNACDQLVLIQKPADIYGYTFGPITFQAGPIVVANTSFSGGVLKDPLKYEQRISVVQFPYPVWSNSSDEELVKEGDLLFNLNESPIRTARILGRPNNTIFNNGLNTQINALASPFIVTPKTWVDVFAPNNLVLLDILEYDPFSFQNNPIPPTLAYQPKNYRIVRNPRILPGEKPIDLPENYEISLKISGSFYVSSSGTDTGGQPILTPSSINLSKGFSGELDLVFDSNGSISSQSANGDVYLWLHRKDAEVGDFNNDAILAIRKKNGSVGIFPINPNRAMDFQGNPIFDASNKPCFDPCSFARNPEKEGL